MTVTTSARGGDGLPEVQIKRRPDGTRYVQPYLGRSRVTGRAIRPYRSFPDDMTDEEVEDAARRWLATVGAAIGLGTTCRLGELLEVYVDSLEQSGAPANTVRSYRAWARSYAVPIASLDARSVTTWMVERLFGELMVKGGHGGTPLSATTVRSFAWFLSGAYRWLVAIGICEQNPCTEARIPVPYPHEALALDEGAMGSIVPALRHEISASAEGKAAARRRCVAFLALVALYTGVRVGEACALRRGDVQARGILHVCGTVTEAGGLRRQPATKGRRPRNVAMPAQLLADCRAHVEWEDHLLGREGVSALSGLPLATLDGGWLRPTAVSREFGALARDWGMPEGTSFHTLRHTHATLALMQEGADPRTVSERLGHADVATTLRIYGHVLPGRDRQVADLFADVAERMSSTGEDG